MSSISIHAKLGQFLPAQMVKIFSQKYWLDSLQSKSLRMHTAVHVSPPNTPVFGQTTSILHRDNRYVQISTKDAIFHLNAEKYNAAARLTFPSLDDSLNE